MGVTYTHNTKTNNLGFHQQSKLYIEKIKGILVVEKSLKSIKYAHDQSILAGAIKEIRMIHRLNCSGMKRNLNAK